MSDIIKISQEQIDSICAEAIEDVKRFDFDFSGYTKKNIGELELLLGKLNEQIKKGKIDEHGLDRLCTIFGVYLGEAMLRNYAAEHGFFWAAEKSEAILMKDDGNKLFPITKVFKRLTRDESENVLSFFMVGKDVADGSFNKNVKPKDE